MLRSPNLVGVALAAALALVTMCCVEEAVSQEAGSAGPSSEKHLGKRGSQENPAAIPKYNVTASCQAAIAANEPTPGTPGRTNSACIEDENAALTKLNNEWKNFSTSQRSLCRTLEGAGGQPSYVEFLTCLELGQAAAQLPNKSQQTPLSRSVTQPTTGPAAGAK